MEDIDGFLVGGASLKPEFATIVNYADGTPETLSKNCVIADKHSSLSSWDEAATCEAKIPSGPRCHSEKTFRPVVCIVSKAKARVNDGQEP